jgi:hypothetical protein
MPPYINHSISGKMIGFQYIYSADMIISNINLLKSYHAVRIYFHFSSWSNIKAHLFGMKKRFSPDFSFALRSNMKGRNLTFLLIILGIVTIYTGFILRSWEK